ncbi:MAG TPA: hypothetical protein VFR33_02355 [Candidatus Dormibacteraeota bacterium]|nr:hypothetical protein [Candidatus Dormibacteraeota bacterium]
MARHELRASRQDEIARSRLVVLQAKRLMLGVAERRYRRTSSRVHLQRVERLRREVVRAQERYASAPRHTNSYGRPADCVRLLQRGNRALDRLRGLQRRLPADRRWEAATDIEAFEEQMSGWQRAFRV